MYRTVSLLIAAGIALPASAQFVPGSLPTLTTATPRLPVRPPQTVPADRARTFMKLSGTTIAPAQQQQTARLSPTHLTDGAAWMLIDGGAVAGNFNGSLPDGMATILPAQANGVRLTLPTSTKPVIVDCAVADATELSYKIFAPTPTQMGGSVLIAQGHMMFLLPPTPGPRVAVRIYNDNAAGWSVFACETVAMG